MCSELIPGFSVLKRLSSWRHAHPRHKQLRRQDMEFWVQAWRQICCAPFALVSGLRFAVPHHTEEENKRTQAFFHELRGNGCLQTLAERRCVFVTVVTMGFWDEIGTNFPEKSSQSWPLLLWDCCLGSLGLQILIRRSVSKQIYTLAADHLQPSLHLSWFTDTWWPIYLFKAKYCALTWWHFYNEYPCCTREACFFLKISLEISIVSEGTWPRRSPHYDCVKCFALTFLSKNSSKVNWALIVPFLPAFYQGLVTFFFVCLCAFPTAFSFSCVSVCAGVCVCFFSSWKMTNGKCENGSLWTWRLPRIHTCAEVFHCVYLFISMNALMHVCKSMCV